MEDPFAAIKLSLDFVIFPKMLLGMTDTSAPLSIKKVNLDRLSKTKSRQDSKELHAELATSGSPIRFLDRLV